jgi:hypothetical protein
MQDAGCNPGHPCPTVDALAFPDALVRLLGGGLGPIETEHVVVGGTPLSCVSNGSAGRAGWCVVSIG